VKSFNQTTKHDIQQLVNFARNLQNMNGHFQLQVAAFMSIADKFDLI